MPPWGWWPLAFVGLALLDRLLADQGRKRRFSRGWLTGAAWFFPSTIWVIDFTLPGYFAAGIVLAGFVAIGCAIVPSGRGRRIGLIGALTLAEFARWSVPFGGIPLSTLPMSQVGGPLLRLARLGGGPLLCLATAALALALSAAFTRGGKKRASVLVGVVALAWIAAAALPRSERLGALRVAVVQGGGPQHTRAVSTDPRLPYQRHLAASTTIKEPVDIVLWPEDVVSIDGPFATSQQGRRLSQLAQDLDAVVIPGIVQGLDDSYFANYSTAIDPDGAIADRYDKVQLVPFGEFVPLRSLMNSLSGGAVDKFIPREALAGSAPAVLQTARARLAIVISWEVFFERRTREGLRKGGEVLINPTNGSSYWLSVVQSQQVASSQLRAVEGDRWALQAAPTGFSAIVDPNGKVVQRTAISEQRVLYGDIERRHGLTPAVRFGPWPWLAAALGCLVFGHVLERRRPRDLVAAEPVILQARSSSVPS